MQMLKEVLATFTPYRGSEATASRVKAEIERRWGSQAAAEYDPNHNARTFAQWRKIGYKVKRGAKAIISTTVIQETDDQGKVIREYPRKVFLFFVNQVERVKN